MKATDVLEMKESSLGEAADVMFKCEVIVEDDTKVTDERGG